MGINEKDFEIIFKKYFVAITAYCNRFVQDIEDSKDIAHKSFMKVWEKRESIPEGSNIQALLYKIAHNLSINFIRDTKKLCSDEELVFVESENSEADNDIRAAELEAAIVDTINHLPEKSRKIFMMSRYDKLTNNKIAEMLDVSIKTVEAHITTALKTLRLKIFGKEK
ncbi:MAG: RNA polymerase sigma-70 factor [Bacteroidales bacterium]|nr:RNA polymerase sigma-70 factor [Bacteroidales bacterium]